MLKQSHDYINPSKLLRAKKIHIYKNHAWLIYIKIIDESCKKINIQIK